MKHVEKSKNKHGVKKKKHEKKEYMRLKEEEASKNVQKELVEEILSEKGWSEMPDSYGDKKAFKKFKKLLKRKVDEKLAQCRLKGRRGVENHSGRLTEVAVEKRNGLKMVEPVVPLVSIPVGMSSKGVMYSYNSILGP